MIDFTANAAVRWMNAMGRMTVALCLLSGVISCGPDKPPMDIDPTLVLNSRLTPSDLAARQRLIALQNKVDEFIETSRESKDVDLIAFAKAYRLLADELGAIGQPADGVLRCVRAEEILARAWEAIGGKFIDGADPAEPDVSSPLTDDRALSVKLEWSATATARARLESSQGLLMAAVESSARGARISKSADSLYEAGRALNGIGRKNEAKALLREAVESQTASPDGVLAEYDPRPSLALAALHQQDGDLTSARECLETLIVNAGQHGVTIERLADTKTAASSSPSPILIDAVLKAHYNLALLDIDNKAYPLAESRLNSLLKTPDAVIGADSALVRSIWQRTRGDCYAAQNRTKDAIKQYRDAVTLDELNAGAWRSLSLALTDKSESLDALRRAAEIRAGDPSLQRELLNQPKITGDEKILVLTRLTDALAAERLNAIATAFDRALSESSVNVATPSTEHRRNAHASNGFEFFANALPLSAMERLEEKTGVSLSQTAVSSLNARADQDAFVFRDLSVALVAAGRSYDALDCLDYALFLWRDCGAASETLIEARIDLSLGIYRAALANADGLIWSDWPELQVSLGYAYRSLVQETDAGTRAQLTQKLETTAFALASPVVDAWLTRRALLSLFKEWRWLATVSDANEESVELSRRILPLLNSFNRMIATNDYRRWMNMPDEPVAIEKAATLALDGLTALYEETNDGTDVDVPSKALAGLVLADHLSRPYLHGFIKTALPDGRYDSRSQETLLAESQKLTAASFETALLAARPLVRSKTSDSPEITLTPRQRAASTDCALLCSLVLASRDAAIQALDYANASGRKPDGGRFDAWLYPASAAQVILGLSDNSIASGKDFRGTVVRAFEEMYSINRLSAKAMAFKVAFVSFIISGDSASALSIGEQMLSAGFDDAQSVALMGIVSEREAIRREPSESLRAAYYYHLVELAENDELAGLSAPMQLGACYERAELPDPALDYYRLADKLSDNQARAGERRAIALLRAIDRPDDALTAAELLYSKNKNDIDAARLYALTLLDANRVDDARRILDLALKTAGDSTALLELDFRFSLLSSNTDGITGVLTRMKASGLFSSDALKLADGLRRFRSGDSAGARTVLQGIDGASSAARSLTYRYLKALLDNSPATRTAFIKAGGSRKELRVQ